MKKKIALGATAVSLLIAGIAMAVTNTYSVTASTVPTKAGTAAAPVNTTLKFNYSVGEVTGQRPSGVKEYQIRFAGIQVSQKGLKTCTAEQINGAGSDTACSPKAVVGRGSVFNKLGPSTDPSSESLTCFLKLTVYNSTPKHATLYLEGDTDENLPEDKRCIAPIKTAIDATYTSAKGAGAFSTLSFKVPPALLHPVTGLDNAVKNVQSTINNVPTTARKNGKKISYYHSIGGCKNNKRPVQVTFISEDDKKSVAKTNAKCTK